MTSRTSTFQVRFTTDGSGAVKADIESMTKAAVDGSSQVNSQGGKDWEEFGRKIGTSIKYAGVAVLAGIGLIVKNTIDAQRELAQLDAVLKSTGNAAGYSRDQLVSMAEGIAQASTFSTGEIVKAETRLLSYSGIAGKVFPDALQIAIDQAARLGIGVEQSAETIGRALESPTKAAAALAQQGFGAAFTKSVKDAIKALEDAGDAAGAQQIVIDILNESYKGAAEAARETLGGALVQLKNTFADLLTGDSGGEGVKGTTQAINDLIETLNSPDVKNGFGQMTEGVFTLINGLSILAGKAVSAFDAMTDLLTLQLGGFSGATGGEYIAKQRAELAVVEKELASRKSGGSVVGGNPAALAGIVQGIPLRLIGAQGLSGSTAAELRERADALRRGITKNEDFFGDPRAARILEGNQQLPDSVLRPARVNGTGTGGTGDPSTTKLKKVKAELSDYEKLMADLGVYEQIWGDAAVDASNAKVDAWEAENEEQKRRAQIAQDVLADIQLENEAMGLSSEQIEIRNNLLRAGVDAESERGQAIVDATKQLQESREAWQTINDLKDITTDFASDAVMNFGQAGDAVEDYIDRVKRLATQMLMEKAVQWLFGMFFGGGAYTGASTAGGDFGAFNPNVEGFSKAAGGKIYGPGTRTSDSIPARLSKDEWVINADAASHYGDNMMADINAKRFAVGGPVSGYSSAAAGAGSGLPAIEFNVSNNTNGKAEMEEPTLTMENGKLIIQTAVNLAVGKINEGLARKGSATNKSMMAGLGRGASYG